MKKRFLALLMALALVLLTVPLSPASASGDMTMKDFSISVWPEYDDPRVLVIYQGTFVNTTGTDLPQNTVVKFNIPKGAEIGMACELVDGGGHSCQPYKTDDKGDYVQLSWKTTKLLKAGVEYPVFLEFYYNPFKGATTDKKFDYKFIPTYTIQKLDLALKQPLKATDFKIDPAPASAGQDNEKFTNHYYTWNNLTVNDKDKVTLKISYTKTDPNPSVKKTVGQQQLASQEQGSSLGTNAWTQPSVIVPVVLFVIILVAFVIYALNNSNRRNSERIHRIKNQAKSRTSGQGTGANPKVAKEKKRLRQMLLNGEISEETYHELLMDMEEDEKV